MYKFKEDTHNPKTYLIEEVIAELRENPAKKFREVVEQDDNYVTDDTYITYGKDVDGLVWLGGINTGQTMKLSGINDKWVEIIEETELTFQEVLDLIEEADKKYEFRLKSDYFNDEYTALIGDFDDIMLELSSDFWDREMVKIIKYGKWFIV